MEGEPIYLVFGPENQDDKDRSAPNWSGRACALALPLLALAALLLVASLAAGQNTYTASADATVRKIDSSGSEVWSFSGTGDAFNTVTTDRDGNVYAGDAAGNIFKIGSDGTELWSFILPSPPPAVRSVAVDGDGNVYVGDGFGQVTKINSTGSQVWSVDPSIGDVVRAVAPDADGNVYVGKGTLGQTRGIIKLDSAGNVVWTLNEPGNVVDAITVDPSGDIFSGDRGHEILKIDSAGNKVWTFTGHSGIVHDLVFDGKGALYSASADTTVKKIDASGPTEIWSFTDPDGAVPLALGIDEDGHVRYGTDDPTVADDEHVHKLETDGSGTLWTFTGHTGAVNGVDVEPGEFDISTDAIAPTVSSVTTVDRDGDGKVDGADVVFSEGIDDSTITPGDWSIGGAAVEAVSTTVDGDVTVDDEKVQLQITTDANEVAGTGAKDVTYVQGTTADLVGNLLASVATGDVAEADGAAPQASTITTRDTDDDGKTDAADVVFTEVVDDSSIAAGDWSIGGAAVEAVSTTVDGDATVDDEKVQLQITTDANEVAGTGAKDVTYTQGLAVDLAGNLLVDVASGDVSEADSAQPTITDLEIFNTDKDGFVDEIVVTFSEAIDTDDGSAPVAADFGTITLPDGSTADLSSATFTDPAGTSATVTISGITGQSTADTAAGSTAISGDLSVNWVDGASNALVATLDDETVTDSAAPAFQSVTTADTDTNGQVDQLTVVFSEAVASGSLEDADFSVGSANGLSGSLGALSSDDGDDTVVVALTEGGSGDTGATPTLAYAQAGGGTAKVQDGIGNLMADDTSDPAADGAEPTIVELEILDTAGDGLIDEIGIRFSETIDTDDGAGPVAADLGTITLPDGSTADLSSATFTDPAGTSATVTISGITGQSTANTAVGSTGIAGDLSANWVDGAANTLVSTSDDESVTDSAAPVRIDLAYLDGDGDGQVDRIDVPYSESLSGTAEVGDYTLGGTDAGSVSLDSATISGSTVQLSVTGPTEDTGLSLTLDYDKTAVTADSVTDGTNAAGSFTGMSVSDAASPTITDLEIFDTDADGLIDKIIVTFSETIDTDDGAAPVAADFGSSIALPDGATADLSSATFTDPAGSSPTVTITGIAGQSTGDTAAGSTAIASDLSANWADGAGNTLVTTLDDETVTDSAAPVFVSVTTADTDADGKVDQLTVVYSEAVATGSVEDADFSIGSANGLSGSLGASSSHDGDGTILFTVAEGGSIDTGATPTLVYAQAGGSSAEVQDAGGTLMVDATSDAARDGAAPVETVIESKDTNGDGTVDRIDVTYSETLSGTAEVGDYTLGGTDAANVTLDSATISGSTVQLSVTGPSDDTDLSLTLEYDKTAGTADSVTDELNAAASFTSASVSDAAPPRVASITTRDADGDGNIDAADVVFTEPIDDSTVTADDWSISGQVAEAVSTTVGGDSDADDKKVQLRITTDANEVVGTGAKDVTYTQGATADLFGNLLADVVSGDVTEADATLRAAFTVVDVSVENGTQVIFTGASTGGNGTLSYNWSFGDGNTSTATSPSHAFERVGTHTVTLTVTDGDGTEAIATTTMHVFSAKAGQATVPPNSEHAFWDLELGGLTLETGSVGGEADLIMRTGDLSGIFQLEQSVPDIDPTDPTTLGIHGLRYMETELQGGHQATVFERVTISVNYTDAQIAASDFDVGELAVFYWNGTAWISTVTGPNASGVIGGTTSDRNLRVFATGHDRDANRVFAVVNHTSSYALGGPKQTAGGGGGGGGRSPRGTLEASVGPESNGYTVHFEAELLDPETPVDAWRWHFYDEATAHVESPVHRFPDTPASYTVTVRARAGAMTFFDTIDVDVPLPNHPPVAWFTCATNDDCLVESLSITFVNKASDLDTDDALTAEWDRGDGTTSTAFAPIHTYEEPGRYLVTLRVHDGNASAETTRWVEVEDPTLTDIDPGDPPASPPTSQDPSDPQGSDAPSLSDDGGEVAGAPFTGPVGPVTLLIALCLVLALGVAMRGVGWITSHRRA